MPATILLVLQMEFRCRSKISLSLIERRWVQHDWSGLGLLARHGSDGGVLLIVLGCFGGDGLKIILLRWRWLTALNPTLVPRFFLFKNVGARSVSVVLWIGVKT